MNDSQILITGQKIETATSGSVGIDLVVSETITLKDNNYTLLPTNFQTIIPDGYVGFVLPRSSTAYKLGIEVVIGTIDQDYRGCWKICCRKIDLGEKIIQAGTKIAQAVFVKLADCPVVNITKEQYNIFMEQEKDNQRKENGFGSTDKE